MGRKRTIDRDATMAAIQSVVRRDGVGGLSIDAVAKEAGISKSSVVYDFQNKAGLLAAFTRNRMEGHRQQLEASLPSPDQPNRWLHAIMDCMAESPSDEDIEVAMLIAAATTSQEECHTIMCKEFGTSLCRVLAEAPDPRKARLAFVALHGLKSLEFLRFHHFDAISREEVLSDIAALLDLPSSDDDDPPKPDQPASPIPPVLARPLTDATTNK